MVFFYLRDCGYINYVFFPRLFGGNRLIHMTKFETFFDKLLTQGNKAITTHLHLRGISVQKHSVNTPMQYTVFYAKNNDNV